MVHKTTFYRWIHVPPYMYDRDLEVGDVFAGSMFPMPAYMVSVEHKRHCFK